MASRLVEGLAMVAGLAAVITVGTFARGDLSGEDAAALSSPGYTCPASPGGDRSGPGPGSGSAGTSGMVSTVGLYGDAAPAVPATRSDSGPEALLRALRRQGHGRYADVFGAVVLDRTRGRVTLCVTDLTRGRALAVAAKAADRRLDLSRLDLFRCRFTEREGLAALSALHGGREPGLGFPVFAVGFSADASGLQVVTTASGAASGAFQNRLVAAAGGMPVHLIVRP